MNNLSNNNNNNNNNYNNSGSFNMSSIDHLFYKPIKNKSTLNKSSNLSIKKKTTSISPINNKDGKNFNSKIKFFNKINTSFSFGKNNKNNNNNNNYIKKDEKFFMEKNHSAFNIGKPNIKREGEKNGKKKNDHENYFQPKNIFSKFKTKREKRLIKEEILLNNKLLIKNNTKNLNILSNSNNNNKIKVNNINKKDLEEIDSTSNKNKSKIIITTNTNNNISSTNNNTTNNNTNTNTNSNTYNALNQKQNFYGKEKEKELKIEGYLNNTNNSNINYTLFKQNSQNNQNNEINSYNLLSHTTLMTGTDNAVNNASQILIDSKPVFKGKKIRCIHDISKTGLSGEDKKVNQDRYFIFRNFVVGFENIFMGVLDGHGYYGQEVSEYIKENLPMDLNRILKTKKLNLLKDDLSQTIKQTFEMENNSLLRNKQIDSNLSGSTCVSVIYTPEKLIIANLGDSRCVLGKKIGQNEWKAENLTRDHKPSIPEEAERIKSYGGRIRPMKDEDGNFVGPLRVYMKEKDLPGLAMTRSFGDYYASTAGTISTPEVSEYKFVPEDKFLILASDGLFEFIESDEVVNIVSEYYEKNDIVGCCEFLYKESYRKWIYEEEDTVDDITIILVFFED
jgi:serine/threonine protein phosphatase PrpC